LAQATRAEKQSLQKRLFVAFSDLAILVALKNQQPLTGYGINNYFMEKVGERASPSTIYSNLALLERKGWIKCVNKSIGRAYDLTEEGHRTVCSMNYTVMETKRFIDKLLEN
jgi:DNA-binding PadR family transcriptional regulator